MESIVNVVIESAANVAAILLAAVLTYAINYLRVIVANKLKMQSTALALSSLDTAVAQTVAELQQTLVEDLKAASEDGKLDDDEIKMLGELLVKGATAKLSEPAAELIKAAGIDIAEYIKSVAEGYVLQVKSVAKKTAG